MHVPAKQLTFAYPAWYIPLKKSMPVQVYWHQGAKGVWRRAHWHPEQPERADGPRD